MKMKSFVQDSGPNGTVTKPCFTCAHCSRVVVMHRADQDVGFCMKCMHHTCVECGGSERCVPFEKKIDEYEKRHAARQRLIGALG